MVTRTIEFFLYQPGEDWEDSVDYQNDLVFKSDGTALDVFLNILRGNFEGMFPPFLENNYNMFESFGAFEDDEVFEQEIRGAAEYFQDHLSNSLGVRTTNAVMNSPSIRDLLSFLVGKPDTLILDYIYALLDLETDNFNQDLETFEKDEEDSRLWGIKKDWI